MRAVDAAKKKIAELEAEAAEIKQLLRDLEPTTGKPKTVPMPDLVAEKFDWNWVIGGLVGRGTTGMIVADPHVGKSTLAIQLCLAIAAGHNTLGWRITEPHRVLYAFAEGARALVAERIKACAASSGMSIIPPTGFVQAPCFADFDVTSDGFRDLIAEARPDFAVLDALGYFFRGDENSSMEWKAKMMVPLRKLTEEFGTSFCIIHHQVKDSDTKKGWQKGRGTSAMFADVDWYVRMETKEGEGNESTRILVVDKNKHGASGQKIALSFDKQNAFFDWRVQTIKTESP